MDFWRYLPSKVVLKEVCVRGGAFRAPLQGADGKVKNRFLFVLNREPATEEVLVLVTPTTQIQKRERVRRDEKEVLVPIGPESYAPLEGQSVVDCGSVIAMPPDKLAKLVSQGQVQPLEPLPSSILHKLVSAIAISRTVSPYHKRMVLGTEE